MDITTAAVLTGYVRAQLDKLDEQRHLLRSGDDDAVHQLRVAARRTRSALSTYGPVLDRTVTDPVRAELAWFGDVLAAARDAQVQRERLEALVDDEPGDLVMGPARARIDEELLALLRTELVIVHAVLEGDRYARCVDSLESIVAEPPVVALGNAPARKVLPELLRRDLKRLRRRDLAARLATDETRDAALHEVRKAAKRLRYAAEGAAPVLGEPARILASRAEALQELLGEHQDTVVAREMLRDIGLRSSQDDASSFTFGRLHALEQARADALRARYAQTFAAIPRPREIKRRS